MFVLDASILASWCFPDERREEADVAFRRLADESAIAPTLLWFELRTVLLMGERRGRLSEAQTARFLAHVADLPIETDHTPDAALVLGLARTHRLSVSDAAYLELAHKRALPLASLDPALIQAAGREGITLAGKGA